MGEQSQKLCGKRGESSVEYRRIKQTTLQTDGHARPDARRWETGREALWDEGRTKSGTKYQEIGQEALGGNDTKAERHELGGFVGALPCYT